jgi:hypothetical protein
MARSRKHRTRKGGSLWGNSEPQPQNTLNNLTEDVKGSLSSLGCSISDNWNKLSSNISGWVNNRKQEVTNTMMGGKRRTRRTKKHSKKRKTRRHK